MTQRHFQPEQLQRLRADLAARLRPDQLKDDPELLASYGRDESDTGEYPSDLVVLAESTEEVSAVARACYAHGVPYTPVGARSGKSGGSLPVHGGVSLSLERMNRILSVSAEDLTAVCQPGVITGDLMKAASDKGLFFPPDPNSWEFCTIGGNVAENAGGPRALKYGVTRDYVLGLQWVMPGGDVLRVGRQTIKGVAGYDLTGLLVGSEGTLGIATEVTLQLLPAPRVVKTALCLFPDVVRAARAVSALLAAGILPRTLELLDEVSVGAVHGRGYSFPPGTGAALLIEVDGNTDEPLLAELAAVAELCEREGALETVLAQDGAQRERLWAARRTLSVALRSLKRHKISEDIVVPRSRLAETIAGLKVMGEELGLLVATYGHAGDGNLHANILWDDPAQRPTVDLAIERMLRLTVAMGGTITGEHGVGSAKRGYLALEQSTELLALQGRLKALFDPAGLCNPGKILP
jgi:glycolate oxidase